MLNAGSFLWDVISGVWNLTSKICEVEIPPSNIEIQYHENHPCARVFEMGHIEKTKRPTINFVQIGGIGNPFECSLNRAYMLSKMQYDGLHWANVQTLDHMGYTDIEELIQSVTRWVTQIQENEPDVPVVLVGFSMGTGVILQVALRIQVDGIILQNAYEHPSNLLDLDNLKSVTDFLMGFPLDSVEAVKHLETSSRMPLQIYFSEEDHVISPHHSQSIANEAFQNPDLQVRVYSHKGKHSDIFHELLQWTLQNNLHQDLGIA